MGEEFSVPQMRTTSSLGLRGNNSCLSIPDDGSCACAVCGGVFGKRRLRLRYQCKVCGQSVCHACSPSSVQVEGQKELQRACRPCATSAAWASDWRPSLKHL